MKSVIITLHCLCLTAVSFAGPVTTSRYIIVDQFGYRPGDVKVAVIADPQTGFNAGESFAPGEIYQVRKWKTDEVVYSGRPEIWNGGATHAQSGDKGWWFDFSDVHVDDWYYIYDVDKEVGSYEFEIRDDIYFEVLKAATRMFYYNRCSIAKEEQYAGAEWADRPSFVGPGQDGEARYVDDKNDASLTRDLSGGWFDAGDFNKYVTFAETVIHQMLDAYRQNPVVWTDNFNIPESGNGIPDLVDEIVWELDWLKKMQDMEDGGVFIKNGSITYTTGSPPSTDKARRYYGPKCSSSSIATAGMFAHAAIVLDEFPSLVDYAADLKTRAVMAWRWYHDNPKSDRCDSQEIKSGDADRGLSDQEQMAVTAAVYLFACTGEKEYDDYVIAHHRDVENLGWWGPYRMAEGDALLYYSQLPNGHRTTQNYILGKKNESAQYNPDFYKFHENRDLYRAHMPDAQYHWGSNCVKANMGNINYDMIYYDLDPASRSSYLEKALSAIHYMHGVNPLNLVYLTNMYAFGAEKAADEIFHGWFANGSKWDNAIDSPYGPAPGYVPGGPNKSYSGSTAGIKDQPPQKAYRESNSISNSWELTEPAIYYQSAYIKLLSKFIDKPTVTDSGGNGNGVLPSRLQLQQNYPNPFNPSTTISYKLSKSDVVTLQVFDVNGRLVRTLVNGFQKAGEYIIEFSKEDLASGAYFCRLSSGDAVAVCKMLLIR